MTRILFSSVLGAVLTSGLAAQVPAAAHPASQPELQAIQKRAEALVEAHHLGQATELLGATLRRQPGWRDGWWQLGSLEYDANDYFNAQDAFARLSVLDPKSGAAWVMLGLCNFERHDFGLALSHLERGRALGFPPSLGLADPAAFHEAVALVLVGEYEQAQVLLDGFARQDHVSPGIVLTAGLAALRRPLPATSAEAFDSEFVQLLNAVGRAQVLAAQRKFPEARAIYRQLATEHPTVRHLHYAFGVLLARMSETTAAEAEFREEIRLHPTSILPCLQLAIMDWTRDDLAPGKQWAEQALQLAPDNFAPHYILGNILLKQGDAVGGLQQLEASRNLAPQSSEVHFALARAYLQLHRPAEAARERKLFEQLKPIEDSIQHRGTLPATMFEAPAGSPPQ